MENKVETGWGVAAYGRCKDFEIDLLCSIEEPEAWQLVLNTPTNYLHFNVKGREVLAEMLGFLEEKRHDWCEINVGDFGNGEIWLVRDYPPTTQIWLKSRITNGHFSIRFADEEIAMFCNTIRDALNDLEDEPQSPSKIQKQ
jgi:frataxin-like iron-binding protein CyaY